MSPAKHSSASVTDRRTDRQTDRQTDDGQSDPYVSLCFAGDTKKVRDQAQLHDAYSSNGIILFASKTSVIMINSLYDNNNNNKLTWISSFHHCSYSVFGIFSLKQDD